MKLFLNKYLQCFSGALFVSGCLMAIGLTSCFTGIEGTKKVVMGRADKKQAVLTEEEKYLKLKMEPAEQWQAGKQFLATDDKLTYIFDIEGRTLNDTVKPRGRIMTYQGAEGKMRPDGSRETTLIFSMDNQTLKYHTGKEYPEALKTLTCRNLPMMIDLEAVAEANSQLRGKRLFTRSALWYEGDTIRKPGRKFVEVEVIEVTPGLTEFPLKVNFRDATGESSFMLMNMGNGGYDSRSFANLFFLSDPRKNYPKISDEVWELITAGKVAPGMTKEECKLALGNPGDVMAGHSYSQTLDIWQYRDGTVLRFADGILVNAGR